MRSANLFMPLMIGPNLKSATAKSCRTKPNLLAEIKKLEKQRKKVTLLFGRNDQRQNQAVILAEILKGKQ